MVRLNCQPAAVLQRKLTILLRIVQNTKAEPIGLDFMLPAFQDVPDDFYGVRCILRLNRSVFTDK